MKYCPKCDKQKDEEEFHNNRAQPDGKENYCKPCKKETVAAYQKTDKGKAVKAKAQRKFINTPHGRAKKQECERNWRKTERGAKNTREKALKRYYSDPEYFRLKAKACNHGVPIGVLKQIQERDKVCQLCGSDKELQFDHINPVSYGGIGSLENLQILCGPCNNFKSNNLFLPEGGMLVTNGKLV
jgi:5-methylcytosine-specific restriction endonuclease McrA